MNKDILRQEAAARRNAITERERRSLAICDALRTLPEYASTRAIHSYLPIRSEVDTLPLVAAALAEGKRVAVPIVVQGSAELAHTWLDTLDVASLEAGVFGTFNPRGARLAVPVECDLFVVPLLAFDRRGIRLGYGKGYYDRLLAASAATKVGVAFAAQEWPALPAEPHDVPLDVVVTEEGVIRVGRF